MLDDGETRRPEDETFTVVLSGASGATIVDGEGVGTIEDDESPPPPPPPPPPTLSIGNASVTEGAGAQAEFTVELSAESTQEVTVVYATSDVSATSGTDYTTTSGTLTIGVGETTGTITVAVLDDSEEEQDETFTVTLSGPSANATILDGTGTGTIVDDDTVAELPALEIDDVTVTEGAGVQAEFTVKLSAASTRDVTVSYATSDGTALAGSDYTTASGMLTIEAGDTMGTIAVTVLDDDVPEGGDETFTVKLSGADGATIEDSVGRGTIEDDDAVQPPPGDPTLGIDDVTVTEGVGASAQFTVRLSETSTQAVTVDYRTMNVTALAGSDYTEASGMLTIGAGNTTGTITVAVLDDGEQEESETFTVVLSGASGATIVDGEGVGTIEDDESPPPRPILPMLRIRNASADEDVGSMRFRVTLSEASAQDVTVDYATSDGTARAVLDYTRASGTLTIDAGLTTGTISVALRIDEVVEEDEDFTVTLSRAMHATIADGEGRGVIRDDDGTSPPRGHATLSIDDVTVGEGDGNAVFAVTLVSVSRQAVTVSYRTVNGTAKAGSDYVRVKRGTLKFGAGVRKRTISVAVTNDKVIEPDETFAVTLFDARFATIVDGEGVGTIVDNDHEPPAPDLPTLSIGNASVTEGGGAPAEFTVRLSDTTTDVVTVRYATADATALADQDYTAASGTLTIAAGDTTETISVAVLDDDVVEDDETFIVTLSAPENAGILDGAGVGSATITDDDEAALTVSYAASAYSVTEGSSVSVTVALSEAPGSAVTIPLTHTPGAGTDTTDYSGVPDSVSFGASETQQTFSVQATEDGRRDDGEQVVLGFGTLPARVAPANPETSTITIADAGPSADRRENRWLRRFGETVTSHVLQALDDRIRNAPIRSPGQGQGGAAQSCRGCAPGRDETMTLVVGGHRLPAPWDTPTAFGHRNSPHDAAGAWTPDDGTLEGRDPRAQPSLPAKEVLAGSTFEILSQSPGDAHRLSFWGRGALSHFDKDHDGSEMDGDVVSATLGVDYTDDGLLAGVAVSHSEGDGSYLLGGRDHGVAATMSALYPYLYFAVNERDSAWGMAGFGSGTMTVEFEDLTAKTEIDAKMGAVGVRRELQSPDDNSGVSVALKSDAQFLRIDSDETRHLYATRNDASRQRVALEIAQEYTLDGGEWVVSFVEVGARRYAGDAGTAYGMEISRGFRYEHPALGLTAEFDARGLLQPPIDRIDEVGVSVLLRYDPVASSNLGPNLALSLSGGLEGWTRTGRLWGQDIPGGWGTDDPDPTDLRVGAEFGHGLPVLGGVAIGTPWVGASFSERRRDWRLGYRLGFGSHVRLGVDGRYRQDTAGEESSDYSVMLRLSIR